MSYTKKQFLEDVAKEAKALKKHATKEELGKLKFDRFNPRVFTDCIYGQITGDCFSERAAHLIHSCCPRYFKSQNDDGIPLETHSRDGDVKEYVNGAAVEGVRTPEHLHAHRNHAGFYFSSVEAYIMQPEAQNKNLIDFLKGERKDLVL